MSVNPENTNNEPTDEKPDNYFFISFLEYRRRLGEKITAGLGRIGTRLLIRLSKDNVANHELKPENHVSTQSETAASQQTNMAELAKNIDSEWKRSEN